MEESTLRWPTDKEREEMEEVCSIGEVYFPRRVLWCHKNMRRLAIVHKYFPFQVWD